MFSVRHHIDKYPDFNVNANQIKAICSVMMHSYSFGTSLFGTMQLYSIN